MTTIVLIDKDDTLVDVRGEVLADDSASDVIAAAQMAGMKVGLHSDSPCQSLHDWHERLGMNGPIIAELGTIVDPADGRPLVFLAEEAQRRRLFDLRTGLVSLASELDVELWVGDVVEGRFAARFPPGRKVLGVNQRRRASFMGFCWEASQDGRLQVDPPLMEHVRARLAQRLSLEDFVIDVNLVHGVIIVHTRGASKEAGVHLLRQHCQAERIVMIGSSLSDYCGPAVSHAAVANADRDFKEHANFVSEEAYTRGVCDILQRLTSGAI